MTKEHEAHVVRKDEALRMALEALESGKPMFDAYWGGSKFDQAITAIKEALSSPNGEAQPEKRTWVGLTDEEMSEIYYHADWDTVNGWEYERLIEAKLKEKNT